MKKFGILAACAIALAPVAVQAQDNTPDPATAKRGAVIVRSFVMAMNSDELAQTVRGQIYGCMYNNPISKISQAAGKILENNPNLQADNPTHVYVAAARACGVTFRKQEQNED
ncbi:hypothetical protein [Altericroceibacterium endophyticum]|uniref:Uncharacterized protein n=1 Tax=Altericroceibacterium endophyticum TaxID=1808508 RepID=A0A6I4T2W1_9SPHN|nr:hypothetical protein [Altericroceibacterium endophyticum]MXO64652.1 hypothetical protein [Altericroceibacterium endophyticum]